MILWVFRVWQAHQRSLDLQLLWPACKEQATDLDHAKAAFAVHAYQTRAWRALGEDELYRQIDALT